MNLYTMDLTTILITFVGILISYYIYTTIVFFTFWYRQGVPSRPYISFAWAFKPFAEFVLELARENGRVYGAYSFGQKILIVNDIDLAKDVCIKNFHKFSVRRSIYFGNSSIARSLFFMPGDDNWKRIRSIVTPAFTSSKLRDMCQPIERILNNFVHHLQNEAANGQTFNIKRYTDSLSMDIIASCGYGINIDSISNQDDPIVANARKILSVDASLSLIFCATFEKLSKWLGVEPLNIDSTRYFDQLTQTIVDKRLASGVESNDLIGLMMQNNSDLMVNSNKIDENQGNKDKNNYLKEGITMSEISAQAILFFIAGYDTTNSTFSHLFYNLTKHPEWQMKLYEEIKANEDQLNYEHLKTLPILNAIINETLRLNPPLLIVERESTVDTYIRNIFVEKGTLITIQVHAIHHDSGYFPDPDTFRPERFLNEDADTLNAFMPFGLGPRFCVGMRFALNELRLCLAKFVQHFQLVANENIEPLEYFKGSILQSPKNVMVKIVERNR